MELRDYIPHEDLRLIRPIALEYFNKVQGRNLAKLKEYPLGDQTVQCLEIDAEICLLDDERAKIRMCIEKGEVVGMMIYHVIYDCVLVIRGMYVMRAFRGQHLGCEMIESFDNPIKKILFQTYISRRPAELFEWIRKWRVKHKKISSTKDIITYECDWEKPNGR